MQTLATTARWVVNVQNLDYDPFSIAPVFQRRPDPPETLPLYDAAVNIDIGSAEIRQRVAKTGLDPILVAAAFNAGGLYKSTKNPWHFKSSGDHLDRAARWYGDACAVMAELQTNA
jgi:peptidoglycan L-alanyl-D-glutamate endopeptidase CwlK